LTHRTLFITTDVPRNGGSGGQIASWRVLQAHATLCPVDLIAIAPPGAQPSPELTALVDRCKVVELEAFYFAKARRALMWKFVRAQVQGVPYRVVKFSDPRVHECVRAWASERAYTVVHCDFVTNWQYAEDLDGPFRLVVHQNIESQTHSTLASTRQGLARWILGREALRAQRHELDVIGRADHTLVLSEADRDWIAAHGGDRLSSKVSVWPVPIEVHDALPRPAGERLLVLGSLRSMGRLEGLRWLLREVWPRVKPVHPHAELAIVGADPPDDVLARDGRDGISVHGYVEDLSEILAGTQACLIPLFAGGGIRVKILELLVRGVPCIGTPLGVQGMSQFAGVVVADTVSEWVDAVSRALSPDSDLRNAALAGRAELIAGHADEHSVAHLAGVLGVASGNELTGTPC
jgi:polysaccharide biosynthesis protein PslH